MREMAQLVKLKSDGLLLLDIHTLPASGDIPDADTLLRDLHLRLPDGTWVTGIDANVLAWGYTSVGSRLAWLRWPVVRPLAEMAYRIWARWRYRRLYGPDGLQCRR